MCQQESGIESQQAGDSKPMGQVWEIKNKSDTTTPLIEGQPEFMKLELSVKTMTRIGIIPRRRVWADVTRDVEKDMGVGGRGQASQP